MSSIEQPNDVPNLQRLPPFIQARIAAQQGHQLLTVNLNNPHAPIYPTLNIGHRFFEGAGQIMALEHAYGEFVLYNVELTSLVNGQPQTIRGDAYLQLHFHPSTNPIGEFFTPLLISKPH